MDTLKYKTLLQIAETGSITATAEQMGYSQSGITQMIRSMEKELGITLLIRTNRGVSLTHAARRLLPLIREEQHWDESIRQECAMLSGTFSGIIHVGCLSSVSEAWMPPVLESLAEKYTDIRVYVGEYETPDIQKRIEDGRLDIGLCEIFEDHRFLSERLMTDEIVAIVPIDHELAERSSVPLSELASYPFISYAIGETSMKYDGWPDMVTNGSLSLDIRYSCKDTYTMVSMVKHHLGVSIASRLMMSNYGEDTVCVALEPPLFRSLGVIRRSGENLLPAARAFLQCLEEYISKQASEQ